jgi:hypothetical protein
MIFARILKRGPSKSGMKRAPEGLRRLLLEDQRPPRLFAVVTWGCAATEWLAHHLNECPGIFCAHAANNLWNKFAGADWLSGLEYLEVIGMQGHAALAAGDVHGVARTDIPDIKNKYGERFNAAVVVRDPLPRLRSQLGLFSRYAQFRAWDSTYLQNMFPDIIKALPTRSYEELLFLHGANMLNAIVEEIAVGPFFRMEDITTDRQRLAALVEHLTGGAVVAPESWLDSAVKSSRTNSHVGSASHVFSDWQVEVLRKAVRPDAIELYCRLGYEVSNPIV